MYTCITRAYRITPESLESRCLVLWILGIVRGLAVSEKWEVLLGTWLLGTTCWCGLSNHQAATAQMHSVDKTYRRVPTPLRSTPPFSDGNITAPSRKGPRTQQRAPRPASRSGQRRHHLSGLGQDKST